jgi:hypothetical protein
MRAKEYLKLRGLNIDVEKVELSVDGLASIMEQYADGMVHEQVKSVDLADVVNCSSCKYQMNGTTEPCRSCILFSNHTPK